MNMTILYGGVPFAELRTPETTRWYYTIDDMRTLWLDMMYLDSHDAFWHVRISRIAQQLWDAEDQRFANKWRFSADVLCRNGRLKRTRAEREARARARKLLLTTAE